MKKLYLVLMMILSLFLIVSCSNSKKEEVKVIERFDINNVTFEICVYDSQDMSIITDCKNIINEYFKIFDETKEYDSIDNVFTLNKNRKAKFDNEFVNKIKELTNYSNELKKVNFLSKNLNDIWCKSVKDKLLPSEELIEQELNKMNNSSLTFENDSISITGDANVSFENVKRGIILNDILNYFEKKSLHEYYVCYNSDFFIYGENFNETDYKVYPSNVKNGYLNLKNKAVSILTSDNNSFSDSNNNKISTIVNAETGKTDSNFTRTICISENVMLLDLLTNYTFSSTIDEIKLAEEKYKYSTIAYNWINLSYISNNLTLKQ